ncbi:MAG: PAS domain S-box protein [Holophaga sp.]|nr:PAS domain S-box protein [Holophaga sp.]
MDIQTAIKTARPLLQGILSTTPDRILIYDPQGVFLFANEASQAFSGNSEKSLLSRTWRDVGLPEAIGQSFERRLAKVVQQKESLRAEETLQVEDGTIQYLETILSPVMDDHQEVVAVLNIVRDITARKVIEEGLRKSEERFERVFRLTPDALAITRVSDGCYAEVNESFLRITGYSREDLLGRSSVELGLWVDPSQREGLVAAIREHQEVTGLEALFRKKDGSILVGLMSAKVIQIADEPHLLTITADITLRRQMEKEARESEIRYRQLFDEAADGIFQGAADGSIIAVNPKGCELTGYSQQELLGQNLSCLFAPEELARVRFRYDELNAGKTVISERFLMRKDRTSLPIEMNTRQMEDKTYLSFFRDISARLEAEAALRRQEDQYRALFLTMVQGVVYQNAQGEIISANPAAEEILGLTLDQMLGRTSLDPRWGCIHEDGSPFLGHEHPAMVALRKGVPVQGMVMGIHHPNEHRHRWAVVNATPEFLPGQAEPWRVFTTITDITALKAAQDDQHQTAQRLHGVLNNSQAVIFQLDPEGNFLLSEGRGLAMLGLLPGQVVGLSALEMYRESPSALAAIKKALTGEPCRANLEVRDLIFDTILSPVFDLQGTLESVIGVSTDVTERERARQSLQESEQRFRDLLEKLGEGFAIVDVNETFTFANPAAEVIFGVGPGMLVGRNLKEFLALDDFEQARQRTERRKVGESESYEESIRRPNQEIRQLLLNVTPLMDPKGNYLGANGVFQDITERRQAEDALRQAQKLESLGVLAGGIAHDFNNLLTAILGNLNLAQSCISDGSAASPYLDNVEKTVLRAAELTKQMLAYSGKGRFVVKVHDLNHVVKEMTHLLQVSIPKKTTLRFLLSPGVLSIEADVAQLHQVVMNLVTNASDAIGEEAGAITIATHVETLSEGEIPAANPGQSLPPGSYAVLEVSDSGCGMGTEVMEKIFDPFFSTKASGRGLGLSAMLGILRGHKAGIKIASQVGKGSTFTIFLPLARENPEQAPEPEAKSSCQFTGQVLVVDDEPAVLEFAAQALERLGFKAITARDGQEAVDLFRQAPQAFHVVLLDLTMPRMDGRESLRELRRVRPEIPVLLSSGFSDQDLLKELATEKHLLFLQKPYQLNTLKLAVRELLQH